MNKFLFTAFIVSCVLITTKISAQEPTQDFQYRRSSLSMVLIESENFPNKDAVMDSWNNFPFPDKYNEHNIDLKSINLEALKLSDQELLHGGFLVDTLKNSFQIVKATAGGKPVRYLNAANTMAAVMPNEQQEYQLKIDKVIRERKLANELIATWFNRDAEGKFDMSLIQERGFYNATEMEASIAQGQARGLASLGDAGEELLRNTFVTFSKLSFNENEPTARAIRDAAKKSIRENMAGKSQILMDAALAGADATYEKTKEGYTLWSKTWLYQLNWNDSVAAVFYTDLWANPEAFDESDLFGLEFVGTQYNRSLVTFKIGEKRTEEQIIDLALIRNVDNAFAKLQKNHEVFKPKVPVLTSDPITAQIGMKEGLSGGEKFDVLEMVFNQKTGTTEYKVVGSATVDKKAVWDNRHNAGEEIEPALNKDGTPIRATTFKGAKSIEPGMLLKQKK